MFSYLKMPLCYFHIWKITLSKKWFQTPQTCYRAETEVSLAFVPYYTVSVFLPGTFTKCPFPFNWNKLPRCTRGDSPFIYITKNSALFIYKARPPQLRTLFTVSLITASANIFPTENPRFFCWTLVPHPCHCPPSPAFLKSISFFMSLTHPFTMSASLLNITNEDSVPLILTVSSSHAPASPFYSILPFLSSTVTFSLGIMTQTENYKEFKFFFSWSL